MVAVMDTIAIYDVAWVLIKEYGDLQHVINDTLLYRVIILFLLC